VPRPALAVIAAALAALLAPGVAAADDSSRHDDTVITITYTGTLKTVRDNTITEPLVTQIGGTSPGRGRSTTSSTRRSSSRCESSPAPARRPSPATLR
jgi:hypothetical protein